MKFHTTFKDIVVAIIVLLSCAAVVLWAMAYIGMPNPSDVFATKLIDRLAGEEGLSIEIGSVGRNYLKELALADLTLSYKGEPLGQIKEVRVPGGIPNILFALALPRHSVRIQTKDITLQLTEEQLEDLLVVQRTESPRLLSFGFILELVDADLDVLMEDGTVILQKSDFEVDFRTGVDALHIAGTAKEIRADFTDMNASVSDVVFGLDSIDRIVLEAQHFEGNVFGGSATCEQLVAVLEELSSLSLSLQNLKAEHPQLDASINQLSLSATGSFSALDSVLLTVASFVGSGPSWNVAVPTTTAHMRFIGWTPRSLSVHTHAELPISFTFDPYGSFSGRELALQLHQNADDTLSGWVSLAEGSDNTYLAAEDVLISLAGRITDSLQLALGVRGDVGVTIPEVDISFRSPLQGEFSFLQQEGTLTAELTLPAVESSVINRPLALSLSMQGREGRAQLEGALFLEQEFDLRSVINIDTEESSVILGARLDSLHAQNFSPIIDRWAPFLKPYIREQTTFNGNISIDAAIANSIPTGRVSADLALLDAQIGTQDLDAGFTFLGMLQGEQIVVPALTLASGGYRLSFAGETEMNYWLPRGELNFHRIEDGQLLASASMLDLPPDVYEVTLVTTGEKQVQAEALVERVEPALLTGDVQFYYQEDSTALSFSAALDTLDMELIQDTRLHVALSLAYPQTLSVQANQFQVPGVSSLFSGDLNASFLDLHNWSVTASSLLLENLPYGGRSYTLSIPFAATSQKITAPDITLSTLDALYEGSFAYSGVPVTTLAAKNFITPYELLFRLDELILITLASDEETLQAVVQVDSFPLGEFGFLGEDSYLTLSLIGETNLDDQVAIDASLFYADTKSSLQGEFSAIDDTFTFSHLDYLRGNLNVHAESIHLVDGILSAQGSFDHLRILSYTEQDTHISISLVADLGRMQTVFELPQAIQRARKNGFTATVTLEDLLLFGEGGIADGTYSVSWDERVGRVDSE
ncbi:MAG TPA: hypothetical protein VFC80_06230, partial [Sphaerochaeta sp.]|nr:hypothetical protein [Sphaerochaeta sp.]